MYNYLWKEALKRCCMYLHFFVIVSDHSHDAPFFGWHQGAHGIHWLSMSLTHCFLFSLLPLQQASSFFQGLDVWLLCNPFVFPCQCWSVQAFQVVGHHSASYFPPTLPPPQNQETLLSKFHPLHGQWPRLEPPLQLLYVLPPLQGAAHWVECFSLACEFPTHSTSEEYFFLVLSSNLTWHLFSPALWTLPAIAFIYGLFLTSKSVAKKTQSTVCSRRSTDSHCMLIVLKSIRWVSGYKGHVCWSYSLNTTKRPTPKPRGVHSCFCG